MNARMGALPSTTTRVENSTADEINARIDWETRQNVVRVHRMGAGAITHRLHELDEEWDMERMLEANAATVSLIGSGLGFLVHRKWFLLPVLVAGFLLQHALQGWCPPVPILRRL